MPPVIPRARHNTRAGSTAAPGLYALDFPSRASQLRARFISTTIIVISIIMITLRNSQTIASDITNCPTSISSSPVRSNMMRWHYVPPGSNLSLVKDSKAPSLLGDCRNGRWCSRMSQVSFAFFVVCGTCQAAVGIAFLVAIVLELYCIPSGTSLAIPPMYGCRGRGTSTDPSLCH